MSEPFQEREQSVISICSDSTSTITEEICERPVTKEEVLLETIRREMASGIIKGNWLLLLLLGGKITNDTQRNLDIIISLTQAQLEKLRANTTNEPGADESIIAHEEAIGRLQEHRRTGTKFTYGRLRTLASEPPSFSLQESRQETAERIMKWRYFLQPVIEELNKVVVSPTATPEERREAPRKATLKRAEIFENQKRENKLAEATMTKEGVSKEDMGENLFEMFTRQKDEKVKARESDEDLASLEEIAAYDW